MTGEGEDRWYHVGVPLDEESARRRRRCGLPVYEPTDPKPTDQTPYLRFARERGPNST